MNRHLKSFESYLLGGALVALASQPVSAATATITDVQVESFQGGARITLRTTGDSPQIFSTQAGSRVHTDLVRTALELPRGRTFAQRSSIAGIESIALVPLDSNTVRLTINGEDTAPFSRISENANGDLVIEVNTPRARPQRATPVPTELATVPGTPDEDTAGTKGDEAVPQLAQATEPAQTPQQPDVLVPNPQITIDGVPIPAPQPFQVAPPFLPRAVAPPVGDISVSESVPRFGNVVDLGTAERVPRLVLRNAPAREVLSLLGRTAGLNVVFVDGQGTDGGDGPLVTIDLQNESVQESFNSILRLTGLQANRVGRTIYIGSDLPDSARNVVSRTLRMNQVAADTAAGFLASLGAEGTQIVTVTTFNDLADGDGSAGRIIRSESTTETQIRPLTFAPAQTSRAPQVLRGLLVSVDSRLNSVTLVGEPALIDTATGYLTQLDLRRRQVAVNLKVIDVNLNALDAVGTSFSFAAGDTSLVNTGGVGIINFGSQGPAQSTANPGTLNVPIPPRALGGSAITQIASQFLVQLLGTIQSGNAKILTDPTLIIQEGQQARVQLTQEVVTNIETTVETTPAGIITRVEVEKEPAGLILTVDVDRIDDNGFVTMSLAPSITAPTGSFDVGEDTVVLLAERQLSSGVVRIRDGQTLVLAGIIQERDRVEATKVPILGDLPIIGALFRSTIRTNDRAEVIILVTPNVLDDSDQSAFGYSYTPSEEIQDLIQRSPRAPQ